jgi:energy-converting hydrogenase Eha subunit H
MYIIIVIIIIILLEYVYTTEQVQLRDRRIAREKKYIQKTLPKDVKRMLMYVIIFAHGI